MDIHKRHYRLPVDGVKKTVYEIDDDKLYFYLKQYILRTSSHEFFYLFIYDAIVIYNV